MKRSGAVNPQATRSKAPAGGGAKPAAKAPPGRRATAAGNGTREKLLNAAEKLFAEFGYYGASLRDVSEEAGLHLALTTYHFGSKERLFDEVSGRRAGFMCEKRFESLKALEGAKGPRSRVVRQLIQAYVAPFVEARYHARPHWRAYAQLMAGIVNMRRYTPLVKRHYDEASNLFIERFAEQFPDTRRETIVAAFAFMVGSMMSVCAQTERFGVDRRSKTVTREEQFGKTLDELVTFIHGGFMAMCDVKRAGARAAL